MRRPAHGATARPGPVRPASGYARPLGRPGPNVATFAPSDEVAEPWTSAMVGDSVQAVISASASASPGDPGPAPAA
jgi:hypothetical protein